jgi:hypothetical protein
MDAGETIRVFSDDEGFASDFVRWCDGTELQVLSLRYPTGNITEVTLALKGGKMRSELTPPAQQASVTANPGR